MFRKSYRTSIEPLEARIAPASVASTTPVYPTIPQAEAMPNGAGFVTAQVGTPVVVHAGQVLTTGAGPQSGSYLLFVQQGEALVFTTDLNHNGVVDPNEITGIAAGNNLRLISFVDIHGDIVTNLTASGILSDSKNNPSLYNPNLRGDGAVLLDNTIQMIEFRSLVKSDLTAGEDITLRYAPTNDSLYGNIFAGGGFGATDGGLLIDSSQATVVNTTVQANGPYHSSANPGQPTVGGIYVGTSASGHFFSFGLSRGDTIHPSGTIATFTPAPGEHGGDILNVGASTGSTTTTTTGTGTGGAAGTGASVTTTTPNYSTFNIGAVEAGAGGLGARGGNITNLTIDGDNASGYTAIAGDGGNGPTGGSGGSIVNFSDLGSLTGSILVQSGSGGTGTTGVGGAAGGVTLGTVNVAGGFTVHLGNGGDGFTNGGNGAAIGNGSITVPTSTVVPSGTVVVSTMHINDGIGRTAPIDFNGDGTGDVVFATQNPNQLVVLLGVPNFPGTYFSPIYLPMIYGNIDAITVGDFLGNGHPDIAVVSGDASQNPGIVVFASKFAGAKFEGFETPRWSPLPDLFSPDPNASPLYRANFGFLHSNAPATALATGDFSGDGHTGIAVAATYYFSSGNNASPTPYEIVLFMKPDLHNGVADGQFYADFGTTGTNLRPLLPFVDLGMGTTAAFVESTALSATSTHDVIGAVPTTGGPKGIILADNSVPSIGGPALSFIALGNVDTDRTLNTPMMTDHQNFVKGTIGSFAITDLNRDGKADFAALTVSPAGYVSVAYGDGVGNGTSFKRDNAGFYFGANGAGIGTNQVAIRSAPDPATGLQNNLAVLDYDQATFQRLWAVVPLSMNTSGGANPDLTVGSPVLSFTNGTLDMNVRAFDSYVPRPAVQGVLQQPFLFVVALPDTTADIANSLNHQIETSQTLPPFTPEVDNHVDLIGGNGGSGLIGAGGGGGSVGTGHLVAYTPPVTTTGASTATVVTGVSAGGSQLLLGGTNITLPNDVTFNGTLLLEAGSGGNGFTTGGNGGSVAGITIAYSLTGAGGGVINPTSLLAGNGGLGLSGSGGDGGSLAFNSIEYGELFQAGNGGTGLHGGNGGSVYGNGQAGFYDTLDTTVTLIAGNGADGNLGGGGGGSVTSFHASFNFTNQGNPSGAFSVTAGNGGNAVLGTGGSGGSVINDSPLNTQQNQGNYMNGDILLLAGTGGDGITGGGGGSISTFVDNPSNGISPAILSILAGPGGHGVYGLGGRGGSVTGITVPSSGQPSTSLLNPVLTNYNYDRILAGDGGASSGGIGGDGGSLSNLNSVNTQSAFAVASGGGGSGLYLGGHGGSVLNSYLQLGGQNGGTDSKLLVIAGKGGNATAFVANPLDVSTPLAVQQNSAFGGLVGKGGAGGDINGVHQTGGISVEVDLIAGNGGDTVNYGSNSDLGSYVGTGGSIVNVSAVGDFGNLDTTTKLKSYNDVIHGQTIQDFVNLQLRSTALPGPPINDMVGSEGIVVGAAGRLKEVFAGYDTRNQPLYASVAAPHGHNGYLVNATARGIESAIAGSVDQIALITAVANITLTAEGSIGINKIVGPGYLDADGNPIGQPVAGGSEAFDGALITATQPTLNGAPANLHGNVFVL